jgi:hypothetical protein
MRDSSQPTDSVRPRSFEVWLVATRRLSQERYSDRYAVSPGLMGAGRRRLGDCKRAMLIASPAQGIPRVGWDSGIASL